MIRSDRGHRFVVCLVVPTLGLLWSPAWGKGNCEPEVGNFVSIQGVVEVQRRSAQDWISAGLDTDLCEGDTVRVGEQSRAAVALVNEAVLRIDQNSAIRLIDIVEEEEETSYLEMLRGAIQSFSRKPRFLAVNTPYLNGSVEGTEFFVRVDDNATEITVFEGIVRAANQQGEVALTSGQSALAAANQVPERRTLVRPRDQVQWALYYPPVFSAAAISVGPPALEEAAACADRGDTACAFAALDQVQRSARDARFHLLRASLLLSVGRVDEARADIDQALERDPGSGQAYALRSVIEIAQNETDQALADARRGVELSPDSPAAKIALSYALQADLQLTQARDVVAAAVNRHPRDALAWARLAELQLMLGNRRESRAAADTAEKLAPGLSRTQYVLGFAALAEIDTTAARRAFERAIVLDSADPLPRLGLGLAKIRRGDLEGGRADLEAAVALDANQSLLRAYLGKAYFEEKRAPLDAEQFAIAKQLDPLDPTAYLYDAIRLQTENRPVAALREVEKSIELNDNRAVYRSRLLLDSDRAARGSSLARIYKDLGFNRLGAVEATRSLVLDPSNAAAHRFLSDLYRDVTQRTEIARVSELLQAQLLQDVNINPVQPSVSATNLNIVTRGGPAEAGFNEFTPLFERNQVRADGTLLAGTNQTASIEGVASAISGPVSLSAGGFFYDTDGFRANNDLQHDIANVFAQWAVSPGFNVQAEYRRRETEHGDLNQNFDLEDFDETFRRRRDGDVFRVGARVSPAKHSDFLVSYIHTDSESATQATLLDIPGQISLTADQAQTDEADQYEAQYIFKADAFNIVTGGAYAESDIEGQVTSTLRLTISPPLPFLPPLEIEDIRVLPTSSRTNDSRGYVYGTAKLWRSLLVTAGVSYQDFERELANNGIKNEFERWNPKLGLRWGVADNLTLRAAYFQAVKPVLVSNRTLEPTQVAGFNQFFDDSDATRSTRFGVGFDWQPLSNLHIGGELTKRELENPVVDLANLAVDYEEQTELLHRLYAYWTPSARWSLSLEGTYDNFENEQQSLVAAEVPDRVTTWTLPISAAYFDPSGWFGAAALTVVNQEVRRDEAQSDLAQGDSSFALVDAAVGYRLPKRSGVFSLSVRNLFDEDFDYQDNSYRSFGNEPYVGPYTPDRTVMARITFNF